MQTQTGFIVTLKSFSATYIWILFTELVLSEDVCVLHLFIDAQTRKQTKGYYCYQVHSLLFRGPQVLNLSWIILYQESVLLYKIYYTSGSSFNVKKRLNCNSIASILCWERKIFQTVTQWSGYFHCMFMNEIIYKTGCSHRCIFRLLQPLSTWSASYPHFLLFPGNHVPMATLVPNFR